MEGIDEGCLLGCVVGCEDGAAEGIAEGCSLGWEDGRDEGAPESEGCSEGRPLGLALTDGAAERLGAVDRLGPVDTEGPALTDGASEGPALGVKDAAGSTHVRDLASRSTYESTMRSATSAITIRSVFHPAVGAPRAFSLVVKPSASMIAYCPLMNWLST